MASSIHRTNVSRYIKNDTKRSYNMYSILYQDQDQNKDLDKVTFKSEIIENAPSECLSVSVIEKKKKYVSLYELMIEDLTAYLFAKNTDIYTVRRIDNPYTISIDPSSLCQYVSESIPTTVERLRLLTQFVMESYPEYTNCLNIGYCPSIYKEVPHDFQLFITETFTQNEVDLLETNQNYAEYLCINRCLSEEIGFMIDLEKIHLLKSVPGRNGYISKTCHTGIIFAKDMVPKRYNEPQKYRSNKCHKLLIFIIGTPEEINNLCNIIPTNVTESRIAYFLNMPLQSCYELIDTIETTFRY